MFVRCAISVQNHRMRRMWNVYVAVAAFRLTHKYCTCASLSRQRSCSADERRCWGADDGCTKCDNNTASLMSLRRYRRLVDFLHVHTPVCAWLAGSYTQQRRLLVKWHDWLADTSLWHIAHHTRSHLGHSSYAQNTHRKRACRRRHAAHRCESKRFCVCVMFVCRIISAYAASRR